MPDHGLLHDLGRAALGMAAGRRFKRGFTANLGPAKIFIGALGGWPNERRTRRGDVKYEILEVLAAGPRHGYDIILAIEERRGARPSAGSIYPTLQMLEDEGSISSAQREGKRIYAISDAGRALLAERPAETIDDDLRDDVDDEQMAHLRQSALRLGAAVIQVAKTGSREARKDARKLLDDARREIYELLGGDET